MYLNSFNISIIFFLFFLFENEYSSTNGNSKSIATNPISREWNIARGWVLTSRGQAEGEMGARYIRMRDQEYESKEYTSEFVESKREQELYNV